MYRTRVHSIKKSGPTRDDVARAANISGATVSRVLSGRTDVPISPEARAKVLEAARRLGYQPNRMARALVTGRTGLVGIWMSLHYSRYRSQVLDRMRGLLGQTELAMAVTDIDEEYAWDHSFDRALRLPVEGIIAFDAEKSVDAFAKDSERIAPRLPFVSMGAYWAKEKSYVGVDLRAGAEAAMDHLIGTGRRRIVFLAPANSGLVHGGPRFEAYRDRLESAGLPVNPIGTTGVSVEAIKAVLSELALADRLPDALLGMNDDMAIAALFACQQLGLQPGRDIAIVGFDGIEESENCPVPITTVQQPVDDMCRLAIEFLNAQMEDPAAPPPQRILKPTLVIRPSSAKG